MKCNLRIPRLLIITTIVLHIIVYHFRIDNQFLTERNGMEWNEIRCRGVFYEDVH